MTRNLLIAVGVTALLAAVLFFSLRGDRGKKGARGYAEPVERLAIARIVKESGRVDPRVKVNISAHVVGKIERLHVEPATVIGVMEERGQFVGQNIDDLVFIPFQTSLQLFGRNAADQVQLRLQAESAEVTERVRDDISRVLRRRHDIGPDDEDDFQVLLQDEIVRSVNTILGSVTAVVSAVVGVALLVGGIGIMNIMLVSVTERTREIDPIEALRYE